MLVYKSRSHSKTVELVREIVNVAMKKRLSKLIGVDHLTIPKNGMTEYHLGYIIEKLEENDFKVELSQGINTFYLTIEWNDETVKYDALFNALKEIESLTRNPKEYEPSIYTINHIARTALNMNKEG